jgi:hypothetical protein
MVPVRPIVGGESGYLRLALLDPSGSMMPRTDLGALQGYPMTLEQHRQLRPLLLSGEKAGKGSQFLRDRLFTVPTHSRFDRSDLVALAQWLDGREPELHVIAAFS